MTDAFAGFDHPLPRPFDPARAERALEALAAEGFTPPPRARAVFESTFGNSPFLARLAAREPATLAEIVSIGPRAALERAQAAMRGRRARRRRCLRDGHPAPRQAPGGADRGAGRHRRALERRRGDARAEPVRRCGHRQRAALSPAPGGRARRHGHVRSRAPRSRDAASSCWRWENTAPTSSTIRATSISSSSTTRSAFPSSRRATRAPPPSISSRGLVKLLAETTVDGYVFRVDLRLRPDAGATQVAISTDAAEDYYESMGQNWERAALIKARACAGDPNRGRAFPEGDRAFRLAAQSRFRGDRRHPFHQAADPRPWRPWRRSRSPATTSSSGAAASARSNSSRRRSS